MLKIEEIEVEGYEKVVHGIDKEAGLNAYISVHDTTLGAGLGGIRMLPYPNEAEALADVNRLAKAMTYKAALAETGQGGGKAALIGDPAAKSEAQLRAMGRLIESLGGMYLAAEDMNMTDDDLATVGLETQYVTGRPQSEGSSGNPSPYTAHGCVVALDAVAREAFGTDSLSGLSIAIHGIGAVGGALARLCAERGAKVTVTDVDRDRARKLAEEIGAALIEDPDDLLFCECDILCPCARGPVFDDDSIPKLRCKAIAGAANNQLADARHGRALRERGILYAPDYVVNAGGIINVSCEFDSGGYREENCFKKLEIIGTNLREIFRIAKEENISTAEAADALAEAKLTEGRKCNVATDGT